MSNFLAFENLELFTDTLNDNNLVVSRNKTYVWYYKKKYEKYLVLDANSENSFCDFKL